MLLAMPRRRCPAPSRLRLHRHEDVSGAVPFVLIIVPFGSPRPHRNGVFFVFQKLFALLIRANDRPFRIMSLGIEIKEIVHPRSVHGRNLPDAPHLLQPRLTFIFFNSTRIDSRFIVRQPLTHFCIRSLSSSSVHRFLPSGGLEQAWATSSVSCRTVYFLGWPERGRSASAAVRPPSRYRFFVRQTVFLSTPRARATSHSRCPRWRSRSARARLSVRMLFFPCVRVCNKTTSFLARTSGIGCIREA